jgi:ribosomal peptide maturation radical SAM protein 1
MRDMKVLLISMPYGALERQALGLSLLKARLTECGIEADVRYLNFAFAEFIGADDYRWVNYELPYTAFAGDWSFVEALYGAQPGARERYVSDVLQGTWRISADDVRRLLRISALTEPFLQHCLAAVRWHDFGLVGFTSTFEQNIASLALAKRLKRECPHLETVFGGANWEGAMGLELHRRFPFVDYVCSGEAEVSLPSLARAVQRSGGAVGSLKKIPGLVFRQNGVSVSTGPPVLLEHMDELPFPDYDGYFRDLSQSTVESSLVPTLLFETSRGCWWGAKSHCTFCGLNGGSMGFRSKTPNRAMKELRFLVDRWRVEMVEAVDNILDMKYFNTLLPALAREALPIQLFYEVKANLSRHHLELLLAAGINRIQPGIESMSDHVLQLMAKGSTALGNIQLLKWCREYNITADWNLLYGFPGETQQDYDQILQLFQAMRFLPAPNACGPVRMDRFSPYFESPQHYGIANVRPMPVYRYLYPFSVESLRQIAYYFDYDYAPAVDPRGVAAAVIRYVEDWQRRPETGRLMALRRSDSLVLLDTRSDRTMPKVILTGVEEAAYDFCDSAHTPSAIAKHLQVLFPEAPVRLEGVTGFLDSLVENRLMVSDGKRYLALALYEEKPKPLYDPPPPNSLSLDKTSLVVLQS